MMDSEPDTRLLAVLFTRGRLRKGWSLERLALESGVPPRTTRRACRSGRCTTRAALQLIASLGIIVALPEPPKPLTAHQAQFGR